MTDEDRHLSREDLSLCAHDLRGILTVIAGYTALLRRSDLSGADREAAFEGIDAAISRADSLLGDTLSGRQPSSRGTRVDLGEIVRQAASDTRAASGREVNVTIAAEPVVEGDPVALARVLQNLLGNAVKYAPEGDIAVRLIRRDDRAVLDVADRGPGIPAEQRDTVFEPFARLERDEESPGTGLGLAVVRGVVERFGGTVLVLDRDGGGTVMRVELPVIAA